MKNKIRITIFVALLSITCLSVGAFIGELIKPNCSVETFEKKINK